MRNALKWKSGNGEMIGFAVASICICAILVIMVAFLQLSVGLNAITKALNVVGRSVAVCTSVDDARTQAQRVAESSVTYTGIEDISTSVDFVNSGDEWEGGKFVNVTVSAKVNTLTPFTTKRYQKKVLICIENGIGTSGTSIVIPSMYGELKTAEGIQLIVARSSSAYAIREASNDTFDSGGFAMLDGRYLIACTSMFGRVGDYIDWYLDDGTVIHTIKGDEKNQADANCNAYGHQQGRCVLEFLVDFYDWYTYLGYFNSYGQPVGQFSHSNPGTFACRPDWAGRVSRSVNLGRNYLDSH